MFPNAAMISFLGRLYARHLRSRVRVPFVDAPPKVEEPWVTLSAADFHTFTRFTVPQFMTVCEKLQLDVDAAGRVQTKDRCKCEKKLAVFIVLRRLVCADSWDVLLSAYNWPRSWANAVRHTHARSDPTPFPPAPGNQPRARRVRRSSSTRSVPLSVATSASCRTSTWTASRQWCRTGLTWYGARSPGVWPCHKVPILAGPCVSREIIN
jgi:hypothetical protein